jgi:predicted transcriptional regulator of viral defense system
MNNIETHEEYHNERVKASELATWLLARGISSITTDDVAALLCIPKNQVAQRLAALKKRNEMVLLVNGLWAPVPPEYKTWGAPPAIDIIDALMSHLNTSYYVGWLSAAAFLGASHHAPQVFQVAVSRGRRTRTIGRSRFLFYQRDHINLAVTIKIESKSGLVPISNRETTLLDIADSVGFIGGIDNAANLIIELCEACAPDIEALTSLAGHYPSSAVRRLGFLMEHFTDVSTLMPLMEISNDRKASVSLLDPHSDSNGTIDKKWNLKINREVSPDI